MTCVASDEVELTDAELKDRLHGRGAPVIISDVTGDLARYIVCEEIGAAEHVLVAPELDFSVLDQVARAGGDWGYGYGDLLQAVDIAVRQASRAGFHLHDNISERACIVDHIVFFDHGYIVQCLDTVFSDKFAR